jgi:hypothetical protein
MNTDKNKYIQGHGHGHGHGHGGHAHSLYPCRSVSPCPLLSISVSVSVFMFICIRSFPCLFQWATSRTLTWATLTDILQTTKSVVSVKVVYLKVCMHFSSNPTVEN